MNIISLIGDKFLNSLYHAGYTVTMLLEALYWMRSLGRRARTVLMQLYICGVESVPVTLVVGIFTGMILSFQTGIVFKEYYLEEYLGLVVLVSVCKELGPFMTAFILAGRVGSAMAAEIGTMKVSEEIDALEVMSINPVDFLVMPRIVALALCAPILTAYVDLLGVLGGAVVAKYQIGVDYTIYFRNVITYMTLNDLTLIFGGLLKGMVFGVTIAALGCANGLRGENGAEGVGAAARKTVVEAFLLILMFNYFMSSIIEKTFGNA
jgi:phospholipid/cholesterol/gamma-HCH transport system permease protein